MTPNGLSRIAALVMRRNLRETLPSDCYFDDELFQFEREHLFPSGWLMAGFSCEVRGAGSYMTADVAGRSLLIVRQSDSGVLAFRNACRHRGSILCADRLGMAARFTCAYHQWTYGLSGELLVAPFMGGDFEPATHGLLSVSIREIAGLLFVCYADVPPEIDEMQAQFEETLGPHQLEEARVAYRSQFVVEANWKLLVENQRECYHCAASHPEYNRAHYDLDIENPKLQSKISKRLDDSRDVWHAAGLHVDMASVASSYTGEWYRANRTPFRPGYVTESLDGAPVGPRMGNLPQDSGTARVGTYYNFWLHATSDHAAIITYEPISCHKTLVVATWLVAENAVDGHAYDTGRLIAFTTVQLEQDKTLLELQARGLVGGVPCGPLSPIFERNLDGYLTWYVKTILDLVSKRKAAI